MKWRTTLVFVFILVALAAYVYFFEVGKEPTSDIAGTPTPKTLVLDVPDNAVVGFEIRSEESITRLIRDGEGAPWMLEAPVVDEADDWRVDGALQRLVDATAMRVITDTAESLESFGLAEPPMVVTLVLDDGREQRLNVGNQTPQSSSYYVQKPGDGTIYLVQTSIIAELERFVDTPPLKPTPASSWTPVPTLQITPVSTPTAGD